ncbi:putative small lipoprotein YifL [Nocardioides thalensis]|uniref:Putative small lipoprotein YifL n=1 Tax=Nocardioides thalensis TaxID=1914755 RepID=A0A853C5U8_9ACTN|nr:hypothetical protein [Nocardioides thalensis]NYJ02052.1 putative small lipoprotein YifL [Nocardioides thalensis]
MKPARDLRRVCAAAALLATAASLAACGDDGPPERARPAAADDPSTSASPEPCGGEPPAAGTVEVPGRATYRTGSFAAEVELDDGTTSCVTSEDVTESGFEYGSYHVEIGAFEDARLTIDQLDDAGNELAAGTISPVVRIDIGGRTYLTSYEREECDVTLLSFTATETAGTFVCEGLGEYTADDPDSDILDVVPGGALPRASGWWVAAR